MTEFHGKGGISVKIIKDSLSYDGKNRLTTAEWIYPRFIHSEVMTHCMLEKNAASSRAIPVEDILKMIEENPAMPIEWGENNPGMVSRKLLSDIQREAAIGVWKASAIQAVNHARVLAAKTGINAHKQIPNRIVEPYVFMKTVISGTEWANFFWLRDHPDADPTFQELARCHHEAYVNSTPTVLLAGQWHLPYVGSNGDSYWIDHDTEIDLETAKKVSASCCAQVSYRKLDDTIEKAMKVYSMLNIGSTDKPAHASPLTHQGTPMKKTDSIECVNDPENPYTWEEGVTHTRRDRSLWSGKFQGWIQQRQLVPNEAVW